MPSTLQGQFVLQLEVARRAIMSTEAGCGRVTPAMSIGSSNVFSFERCFAATEEFETHLHPSFDSRCCKDKLLFCKFRVANHVEVLQQCRGGRVLKCFEPSVPSMKAMHFLRCATHIAARADSSRLVCWLHSNSAPVSAPSGRSVGKKASRLLSHLFFPVSPCKRKPLMFCLGVVKQMD